MHIDTKTPTGPFAEARQTLIDSVLTSEDIAEALGITVASFRSGRNAGEKRPSYLTDFPPPAFTAGSSPVWLREEVQAYLDELHSKGFRFDVKSGRKGGYGRYAIARH